MPVARSLSHRVFACLAALTLAASVSAQAVHFTDVTDEAGLAFLQWDGVLPSDSYALDLEMLMMSAGAAAADYNDDGLVDLYVTRLFAPNLLFRNNGDGSFSEVAEEAGVNVTARSTGCSWGDVDNDGLIDLYVLTIQRRDRNRLYINNGDGTFREEGIRRGVPVWSPWVNFGTLDQFPPVFCERCCTGSAFGDYDLDGDLDLIVVEWGRHQQPRNLLFRNNGAGYFTEVTQAAGVQMPLVRAFAPGFSDIDLDGWPDLLVAADFGTSRLFMNKGNGTFVNRTSYARVGTDENGMGSAIADIDNDGDFDWFVTSIYDPNDTCDTGGGRCNWGSSGNRLFQNDTVKGVPVSLRFSDATDAAGVRDGGWGWGASFFDCDNDGDLDLGMTNGIVMPPLWEDDYFNDDPVRLWENDGSGGMTEIGASVGFDDTGSGKGFVTFDYDNDGDLDVYIANNAGYPVLYRNDSPANHGWLKIDLRGTQSNSFGVGARVYVRTTPNGPEQLREMTANSNYMSQNETMVHFGFGPDIETVDRIRVVWPRTGTEQVLRDVPVNQRVLIVEP